MLKMLCLLCFFVFFQTYAQNKNLKDTSWNLICLSKSNPGKSRIIRDGDRVIIKDNSGNKHRGYLLILNDSTLSVNNNWVKRHDTIYISNISFLMNPRIVDRVLFVNFAISGIVTIGVSTVFFGWIDGVGEYLLMNGLTAEVIAIGLKNGKRFGTHFTFKTYQAKGFKLKKKHLRYLYPKV